MFRRKSALRLWVPVIFFFLAGIYWLTSYSGLKVKTTPDQTGTDVAIEINFFLPMRSENLTPRVTVIPENLLTPVNYEIKWVDSSTVVLRLNQTGYPQGQLIKFQIKGAPTIIPLLTKSVKGEVRPKAPLTLISSTRLENIPSRGPVPINFSTPVDTEISRNFVTLPIPGRLKPVEFSVGGKTFTDFSRWHYYPDRPFENNAFYRIILNPGIRSTGGMVTDKRLEITYTTATAPKVISTEPNQDDNRVRLYRTIEFILDQPVYTASVKVSGLHGEMNISGKTEVQGNKVIFRPSYAFLPGKSYKAKLQAESKDHEPVDEYEFSFTTVDMGENYWVDVKLAEKHTVTVYQGSKLLRQMPASGGKSETPTPLGDFYTQDRGQSFWSPRFGEGATYWVRLVGQVLVHSVPRDSQWRIKEDEHAKLGLPASHGCIRLSEEDAKWFYENIPTGTLVIIHQ